jgi:hypothetical protein
MVAVFAVRGHVAPRPSLTTADRASGIVRTWAR